MVLRNQQKCRSCSQYTQVFPYCKLWCVGRGENTWDLKNHHTKYAFVNATKRNTNSNVKMLIGCFFLFFFLENLYGYKWGESKWEKLQACSASRVLGPGALCTGTSLTPYLYHGAPQVVKYHRQPHTETLNHRKLAQVLPRALYSFRAPQSVPKMNPSWRVLNCWGHFLSTLSLNKSLVELTMRTEERIHARRRTGFCLFASKAIK